MRLDTAREETITNLGGSQKFKMNASAKAFQILSSGIYERKEEAIVRELGCNAYDSHFMAGKADLPFKIHLPTPIDPIFSVEDFGVGLSEDEVYNVYTTYFESTKTDSNDVIGALGLGSKTPFSYTDSFTITARKDGKECVFTASISQTGEPEVVKLYERPTSEENGVKVSMEVSDRDIYKFVTCAEKVYSWFKVKPECNKHLDYDISDEVLDNINLYGYHLRSNEGGFGRHADCKVIMGNVAYDLNLSDIRTNDDDDFNSFLDQLNSIKADLYFSVPIGDADVAASRETLSLDGRTVTNLQDHMRLIRDTFVENTEAKAKKMRSVYEAFHAFTGYERSLIKDFDINGHTLKEIISGEGRFISTVISEKEFPRLSAIADNYDFTIYGDYGVRNYTDRSKRSATDNFHRLIQRQDDGTYKFPVVINDCERKMGLKDALVENRTLPDRVLVVSDKNTTLTPDLEKLLDHVTKGCYYVIYASTFWDGKLAANKKSSTGLADEVVKARSITKDRRYIDYRKIDLSVEDKSRWAYTTACSSGDEATVCGRVCSRATMLAIMEELDLDGVVIYNGNNEKKVKRILPNNLNDLVKAKANVRDVQIGHMQKFVMSEGHDSLRIFDGYVNMADTIINMTADYYQCSLLVHRDFRSGDVMCTIQNRIKVFKDAKKSLMGSGDMMLTTALQYGNFRDANMLNQVKEYIKQRKEK